MLSFNIHLYEVVTLNQDCFTHMASVTETQCVKQNMQIIIMKLP
jgi:hypothetical protein